jgi:hypothetical protein
MSKYNGTSKQERLTFSDTKEKQELMRDYLSEKIKNPIVIEDDCRLLPEIISDALLSQPALSRLKPTAELHGIRIPLAPDVYSLLLKILEATSYKKEDEKRYVKWTLRERGYEIELSVLWRLLLNYCNQLSSGALAEALSRSKEKEIRSHVEVHDFIENENQS